MNQRYALITGASSGIGLALASIFASKGHHLVLTARRKDKLEELATQLRAKYTVQIEVVPMDLAQEASPKALKDILTSRGIEVSHLINNAGFGDFGPFDSSDAPKMMEMMQLNMLSLVQLTHLFLPEMKAKRQGHIVQVASIAAFLPGPYMAVYFATKAFVLHFSEALAEELKGTGVHVMVHCPGLTASGFQEKASMHTSGLLKLGFMARSEQVASHIYASMQKGKVVAIHGWVNKALPLLCRVLPRGIARSIVAKVQTLTI